MNNIKKMIYVALFIAISVSSTGCATYKTLDNITPNSPKFFSGTRLNANAINKNTVALKKFKVSPPKYPFLDLPGSFLLDLVASPATGIMAIYDIATH